MQENVNLDYLRNGVYLLASDRAWRFSVNNPHTWALLSLFTVFIQCGAARVPTPVTVTDAVHLEANRHSPFDGSRRYT
ncbi:hypothetical protein DPMN_095984 [Dreissena polymorpha]|uniref:Uncharacterized protein n=1 Tax=Dreissena polymorpha TaxID=45954 RepID=A0A9D4L7H5_DREPO|nr:hypothetical protein DPMN_095984 [Dreissena polymorpha]